MAVDGYLNFDTRINTKGFNVGTKQIVSGITGMKSLFGKLGLAISGALAVRTLIRFGKQAIETASDIQEVQNVVDVTFGHLASQMEEFADKAIETYGISKLTAKQTGSTYMAMAKGMGIANEAAAEMSLTLTGLSADMASFYNKEQSVTATALDSIFTGETETLKKFGIVMTEANLQNFAYTQGINKKISAMTQAEKVQLRYNYVLQQTALAQGDFLRTQDSWANQTRILTELWKEFAGTVGTILMNTFLPALNALNKAMVWLNTMAQSLLETLAAVFDWDISSAASSSYESIGGAISDAAAQQGALNEATAEYQNQLMGFDKINKLSDTSSGNGSAASVGGVSVGSHSVPMDIDTTKAERKLTDFQQKLKDFVSSFKITFNDIFFEWDNLTGEQIAEKAVAAVGGVLGGGTGFIIGGVPGAVVGSLVGVTLSTVFSSLTFDHDGTLSKEEIASLIKPALLGLGGGVIGWGVGGLKGATIGLTIGASLGAVISSLSFDNDSELSADEIGGMILEALLGGAGAIIGGVVAGPTGIALGASVGIALSFFLNEITDWGEFWAETKQNVSDFATTVEETFSEAGKGITHAWSMTWDWVKGIPEKASQHFSDTRDKFSTAWNNLVSPVKDKTAQMKAAIVTKTADFKESWNKRAGLVKNKTAEMRAKIVTKTADFKESWNKRASLVKGKTANMKLSFSQKVADIKEAAQKRYNAVTSVFSVIPNWFYNTFHSAWNKVRSVFSKGGEVFSGIKDGILHGLKSVINSLIDGINSVIAVPFNGINSALGKIKNISIAGTQPFYNKISYINVPKIPRLATGTVVPANYGEFLAILGDNKRETEVVSPLSTIKKAVREVLDSHENGDINLNVYLDGKIIYKDVVKRNKQNTKITGVNALA